jgi:XTP/dITP diphosphohydrolase
MSPRFPSVTGVVFFRAMTGILIATRNLHKVTEIRAILGEGFQCLTLDEFPGAPDIVEDAPTFAGNATKKSTRIARWLGDPGRQHRETPVAFVLADDSGLEVDALQGAPGVHSARFAALETGESGNSSTTENNAKLLRLLKNVPAEKRTARFRCVIALTPIPTAQPMGSSPPCLADEAELSTELFEGACKGRVEFAPRGNRGFGYDPLFVPEGFEQTFAQLGEETKNRLSHRARALEKVREWLAVEFKDLLGG